MAVQDSRLAGYGVRPLTEEEIAARDARQAAYQQELLQRQAQQVQQFQQTQQAGLANQAGRAFVDQPQAVVDPQQMRAAGAQMRGVADRAVANALPPTPLLGARGAAELVQAPAPVTQQQQATTLSPEILADANQRIAQTLAAGRPTAPAAEPERGNYNMMNTDRAALAQRAAPTNGINFGFGVGGSETARQYLDRMSTVDQQRADYRRRVQNDVERIALGREARGDDPFARRAARERLAELAVSEGVADQQAGETQRTGMQTAGQIEQERIRGQLGVAGADLQGQYALQEAELAGQYGVEAATQRAVGAVQAAQAGADPLKEQRAALLATRLRQLNAKIAAGTATDEDFLNFTATTAAQQQNAPTDLLTGARMTPEQERLLQQQAIARLQQTR